MMDSGQATPANRAWHTLPVQEVFAALHSEQGGLAPEEAARRLAAEGPNELQAGHRISPWAILLAQFQNVLIIILLIATVLSTFLGHGLESLAIAIIVLFAVLLGFVQEFRAERAIEALNKMAAPAATAVRGGRELQVPARELVPGDVILLRAGDRVPADVRLIEAVNLRIEEAALTGESVAVDKNAETLSDPQLALGDRRNMAFASTAATYGRGRAVVVATGMRTEFGQIAQMLQSVQQTTTPLQQNLDKVGRTLAKAAFVVVGLIVLAGLWREQPFVEMLIFGVALAVAVVPEALPAVVTVSLAIGVQRMVQRHALIRRLPAVETLGSTSVICSDKTGTLTKDEMTTRRIYAAGATTDVTGSGYEPKGEFQRDGQPLQLAGPARELLQAALLASDAEIAFDEQYQRWRVKGDPTEGAMVVAAAKAGLERGELEARWPRVDEIPFTSETKRMTTLHRDGESTLAFSKGAPEVLVASCSHVLTDSGPVPLSESEKQAVAAAAEQMAQDALRVLAVAKKSGASREDAERDMTLLGLIGMIDPPRPEASAAIAQCEQAGIKPVMITGDHPLTAQAIAREIGLLKTGRVITGAELQELSDEALAEQIEDIDVYARVSPAHKLRVVTVLQQRGHIVAMTGDGVNDAPALKRADIGVAMGITGTDVSKEAADMTLTDDNFASIVAAVEEGRAIYGNIKKYLMYLLSSNIGEIVLMAVATILGWPMPLTAVQILYVNLATDGLPALALALDPAESDLMRRHPRNPRRGIFTRPVVILMLVGGLWSGLVNLSLFAWARASGRSLEESITMTFVSLVLIQFTKVYSFRSESHSVLDRPFANKWLNRSIVWELALLVAIIYIPFLQKLFATYALPPLDWVIITICAATVCPVMELAKWLERRGWLGRGN